VVIPRRYVDEIVVHAREGAPEEVCGILARDAGGGICGLYRVTNVEHSPRFYVMDSQEQLKALLDIDNRELEVAAIYHSHPATEPRPSKTDIELAKWPGVEYVIVSLADPDKPELRVWTIEDGDVADSELRVIE
jgi:[CysO sulfur-carrier protein]-S-L-cysteine hydrolase